MRLERAPQSGGDRRRAVAARDPEAERRRYPREGEILVAQSRDEHGEKGARGGLDRAARRSARELGGDREQGKPRERPEERGQDERDVAAGVAPGERDPCRPEHGEEDGEPERDVREREERHRQGEREGGAGKREAECGGGDREPGRPAHGVEGQRGGDPSGPGRGRDGGSEALLREPENPGLGDPGRSPLVGRAGNPLPLPRVAAELCGEPAGRRPLLGIGIEPARDGGKERRREIRPELFERRRAGPDPPGGACGVAAAERVASRECLPEDDADAPHIGGGGGRLSGQALGGDIGQGPRNVADGGERVELGHLGQAEVEKAHVDPVPLREQHVGRLDVAMDDPLPVGMRQGVEHLGGRLDRFVVVQLAGVESVAQRPSRHVLVCDVDMARVARQRVDPLAAGMPERSRGTSLALGALGDPALPHHHLQGDVQPVSLVTREPHMAHPARAERPKGAVSSEYQVGCESGGSHVRFYFAPR